MQSDASRQLERRRQDVAERWDLDGQAVLIGAGELVPIPGRGDRTYPFRAHSEYFYLTDRERPGGVLAYDPDEGWIDFVRPVSRDELLWEGAPADGQAGVPIDGLEAWLARRQDRPVANLGAPLPGLAPPRGPAAGREAGSAHEPASADELRRALNHVRRQKDPVELERMRAAERATAAGFAAIVPQLQAGRTEREIQIELEAEFLRRGADFLASRRSWPAAPTPRCCTSRRRQGSWPTGSSC
jgi:Xaa-Pro aminopeptidase